MNEETTVGVPLSAPVEVSKERPAGSVGVIDQDVPAPPLEVGVTDVMATPLLMVHELGLYVMADGAASVMSMVTVAVALPPVLVAVMVYVVEADVAVGVPLMAPVDASKERPAGNDGEIDHATTAPPLDVGVTAVMAESFASVNEFGV